MGEFVWNVNYISGRLRLKKANYLKLNPEMSTA